MPGPVCELFDEPCTVKYRRTRYRRLLYTQIDEDDVQRDRRRRACGLHYSCSHGVSREWSGYGSVLTIGCLLSFGTTETPRSLVQGIPSYKSTMPSYRRGIKHTTCIDIPSCSHRFALPCC